MDIVIYIQKRIYNIRGKKVVLDIDLAIFYQLGIHEFSQTIKQNKQRFPEGTMFRLTKKEWEDLKLSIRTHLQTKIHQSQADDSDTPFNALPYAFTEQAISILGGIFNSSIAIKINIAIMQALV